VRIALANHGRVSGRQRSIKFILSAVGKKKKKEKRRKGRIDKDGEPGERVSAVIPGGGASPKR